jgi:hypothetical protein
MPPDQEVVQPRTSEIDFIRSVNSSALARVTWPPTLELEQLFQHLLLEDLRRLARAQDRTDNLKTSIMETM